MGKAKPKGFKSQSRTDPLSRPSLHEAIQGPRDSEGDRVKKPREKKGKKTSGHNNDDGDEGNEEGRVSAKDAQRLFDVARAQLEEEEELDDEQEDQDHDQEEGQDSPDGVSRREVFLEEGAEQDGSSVEAEELEDEDREAVEAHFAPSAAARRDLAAAVLGQLRAEDKEMEEVIEDDVALAEEIELSPKVVSVYRQIGGLLHKYRSGKLPKAFKMLPQIKGWERLVQVMTPIRWSPQAMREATQLFAGALNARLAQGFYEHVLMPRVIEDMENNKGKLNFHLYHALKASMYKPAAFFKGILFPLCQPGTCTLAEASIIASVMAKVSIPVLHAAAAIVKMAEGDYSGPVSIFMRTLIDKKYALPYRAVDSLVQHFHRTSSTANLPVLWHQSLLVFVQRYREDLTEEQRELIRDVLRLRNHPKITPEIRRELFSHKAADKPTFLDASSMIM